MDGFSFFYIWPLFILQQGMGFEKFVLFVLILAAVIKDRCPLPQKLKVGFAILIIRYCMLVKKKKKKI